MKRAPYSTISAGPFLCSHFKRDLIRLKSVWVLYDDKGVGEIPNENFQKVTEHVRKSLHKSTNKRSTNIIFQSMLDDVTPTDIAAATGASDTLGFTTFLQILRRISKPYESKWNASASSNSVEGRSSNSEGEQTKSLYCEDLAKLVKQSHKLGSSKKTSRKSDSQKLAFTVRQMSNQTCDGSEDRKSRQSTFNEENKKGKKDDSHKSSLLNQLSNVSTEAGSDHSKEPIPFFKEFRRNSTFNMRNLDNIAEEETSNELSSNSVEVKHADTLHERDQSVFSPVIAKGLSKEQLSQRVNPKKSP